MFSAFGYDANGNLISDGVRTFTGACPRAGRRPDPGDALNRLKSVAGGPAATTLAYDPFGRLDSVTASGATTTFRYGGSQLGGEFNLSSAANYSRQLRIYLYAGGGETPLLWLEGVTQLSTTLTQTPAWFHTDRLVLREYVDTIPIDPLNMIRRLAPHGLAGNSRR